jgi:hypothetical protein
VDVNRTRLAVRDGARYSSPYVRGTIIRVTVTAGSEWMANPDKVLLAGGLPGGPAPGSATTTRGSHTTGGRRATTGQRGGSTVGRRRSGTGAHLAVPGNAPVAAAGGAHRAAPCSTAACCPCSSASCATRSTSAACALRKGWAPGQCDSASGRYEDFENRVIRYAPCLVASHERWVADRGLE